MAMVLLCPALIISCSEDSGESVSGSETPSLNLKSAVTDAENKSNPYDYTGLLHEEFVSQYQSGTNSVSSLQEVSLIVSELMEEKAVYVSPSQQVLLASILNNPEVALTSILQNSGLSVAANNVLLEFIGDFHKLSEQSFSLTYTEITAFENDVQQSVSFTETDKRVILSVTSIARHSLNRECDDDPDWDTSVGNIVAATAGALQNTDLSIQYSLITRISQYEGIVP